MYILYQYQILKQIIEGFHRAALCACCGIDEPSKREYSHLVGIDLHRPLRHKPGQLHEK